VGHVRKGDVGQGVGRRVQVAEQHTSNRRHALVCDHCFRHVGPMELQLGFRLLGCTAPVGVPPVTTTARALLSASVKLPTVLDAPEARASFARPTAVSVCAAADQSERLIGGAADEWLLPSDLRRLTASARHLLASKLGDSLTSRDKSMNTELHDASVWSSDDQRIIAERVSSQARSSRHQLGAAVVLPDGSPYVFCSHACAALAWVSWAAVLSPGKCVHATACKQDGARTSMAGPSSQGVGQAWPGEAAELPREVRTSPYVETFDPRRLDKHVIDACTLCGILDTFRPLLSRDGCVNPLPGACTEAMLANARPCESVSGHAGASASGMPPSPCRPPWLPPAPVDMALALREFYDHADKTNDIFRVAARAVAKVASSAHAAAALRTALTTATTSTNDASEIGRRQDGEGEFATVQWQDIALAWRPFKGICRAVWWENVPMPEDLTDEGTWRRQLRCDPSTCRLLFLHSYL
jgi:hypothetical protein